MGKLRIGILGAAGIASKTAIAISYEESQCIVTAIASRSQEKAEKFIEDCPGLNKDSTIIIVGGPNAYSELIQKDYCDALYIPLPVTIKKEWVLQALQHGKHVVLEKPAALTASDYQEMLSVAYAHGKFLLDGTMFPHHERTRSILQRCSSSSSTIGTIDRIQCSFTFLADEAFLNGSNIRSRKDGDPQGCIGDLGWYCIRFGLLVYHETLQSKVVSAKVVDFELNQHGVPIDATCVIRFEGGKVLWFHCGFKTPLRQLFEICGTKKSIVLDDLVLPRETPSTYTLTSTTLTAHDLVTVFDTERVECSNSPPHEVLLWKTFASIAPNLEAAAAASDGAWKGTSKDQANNWGTVSLWNQKVIDALMTSIAENGSEVKIS